MYTEKVAYSIIGMDIFFLFLKTRTFSTYTHTWVKLYPLKELDYLSAFYYKFNVIVKVLKGEESFPVNIV